VVFIGITLVLPYLPFSSSLASSVAFAAPVDDARADRALRSGNGNNKKVFLFADEKCNCLMPLDH